MVGVRVIPCLLLKGRGLVKTVNFSNPKYVGDPVNAVKIFNEKEADELVFLDITATVENRKPNFSFLKDIASECFMPFAYGGGIRDIDDIYRLFKLGVEKVIINSYVLEDMNFIKNASDIFGSQSIVVAVDVKRNIFGKYNVYSNSGRVKHSVNILEYVKKIERNGAGEIFVNSIDRDGTMRGYDLNILKQITEIVNVPVVACGGAGTFEDLELAIDNGVSAAAAGSLFVFHGPHKAVLITYPSQDKIKALSSR